MYLFSENSFFHLIIGVTYYHYMEGLGSSFANMKVPLTALLTTKSTNIHVSGAAALRRIIVLVIMAFVFAVMEQNYSRCTYMQLAAIASTRRFRQ